MKRAQSLSDALAPEPKKRNVAYATYQKLKTDMDRECLTVTRLDCDTELMSGRKNIVTKLRCSVCATFKTRIATRRNVSERWLRSAESVRTGNIRDHARVDQRNASYCLYCCCWSKYAYRYSWYCEMHIYQACMSPQHVYIVQAIWKSGQSNLILVWQMAYQILDLILCSDIQHWYS